MKTLQSIATIVSLIGLMVVPGIASANNITGVVTKIRTCNIDSGGQKVVIWVRSDDDGKERDIYIGVETAGSTSLTSVATAALLSGRKVNVEYSPNAAMQCGTMAQYGNSTNYWIEIR